MGAGERLLVPVFIVAIVFISAPQTLYFFEKFNRSPPQADFLWFRQVGGLNLLDPGLQIITIRLKPGQLSPRGRNYVPMHELGG